MLSSMTDRLRETADKVERIKDNNADWLWRDGVTLMDAVMELRDAADTINYLRCTCNDLQVDYNNLRNAMWNRANARAIDFMEEDELRGLCADLYDHIDELKSLVGDMYKALTALDVDYCQTCPRDTASRPCARFATSGNGECSFVGDMRELGVETK